jgi:ceramide glucosyltransferase
VIVTWILGALACLSCGLTLWQWVVARRFPLHTRQTNGTFAPAVTLLKPLKGRDPDTEDCLRSWFTQQYSAPVQILFGVALEDDPVCPVVRQLIAAHRGIDAALIICGPPTSTNAKVSTLIQLQAQARHDLLVISDADVWVPPDLLQNIVAPLTDRAVGLVNCFYQLGRPSSAAMEWEAIAINADFWSQVLQSRSLKALDFALGAVMATTRSHLDGIGGFAALRDYLADDYQLGHKIAANGARIDLCPTVVECRGGPGRWADVWTHQLRWTRTIRVCQPVPFFFSILSNAALWPLLWLFWVAFAPESWLAAPAALLSAPRDVLYAPGSPFLAPIFLLIRLFTARDNYRRLTGTGLTFRQFGLVLLKDLLGFVLWALALFGNSVVWRGQRYRLLRDGRLQIKD